MALEEADKLLQDCAHNNQGADQIMSENHFDGEKTYLRRVEFLETKKINKEECLYLPDYDNLAEGRVVDEEIECN